MSGTTTGFRKEFDLGIKMTANDESNGDVVTVTVAPGFAGTVVGIRVIMPVLPTAATLAIAKGTTNLLTATNLDLAADIVAATVKTATLSTSNLALKFAATDYFSATWTLTTVGSMTGAGCTVIVEPDEF